MSATVTSQRNGVLRRLWAISPNALKNLVRRARDPKAFALYEQDYRAFAQRVRWIVEALRERRPSFRGEVLVNGLHAFVPSFKEEFVFASVLSWHGYRPVFVVDQAGRLERYVSLIPGVRLVDWNQYDPQPREAEAERACELLATVHDVRGLVALQVEGFAVGRNALSRFMQQRRIGTIDVDAHRLALTDQIAGALAAIRASRAILKEERAELVLMNERGYTPLGEFFDAALLDGRRVVQYVSSFRDDARVYKAYAPSTRTQHPYALSDASWAQALAATLGPERERNLLEAWEGFYRDRTWFNFQRLQHGARLHDREAVFEKLGLDPAKKTAVIYAHIFWDATFFYGESLYEDYRQWLVDTVRQANANPRLNWVVKLHPVNVWRKQREGASDAAYAEAEAIAEAGIVLGDHVKLLMPETDISSWSLFHAADYCLTVRGTVGLENAALGKRVIVAGSGHYSDRGFTLQPATVEAYRELLSRLESVPPMSEEERARALKYGYWQLNRKPYRMSNYRMRYASGGDVFHALNGELEVLARDAADYFEAADVVEWVRWLTRTALEDCLAPDPGGSDAR